MVSTPLAPVMACKVKGRVVKHAQYVCHNVSGISQLQNCCTFQRKWPKKNARSAITSRCTSV